jgi:hypothetical protein
MQALLLLRWPELLVVVGLPQEVMGLVVIMMIHLEYREITAAGMAVHREAAIAQAREAAMPEEEAQAA